MTAAEHTSQFSRLAASKLIGLCDMLWPERRLMTRTSETGHKRCADGHAALDHHVSRSAAATGRVPARMAGKRPPSNPIGMVTTIAVSSRRGVTLKAKATWLKLCQLSVEVR